MFGSLTLVLAHPLAPLAWWALHQPSVIDELADALGVGEETHGAPRQLDGVVVWTEVETKGLPDGWLTFSICAAILCLVVPVLFWTVVAFLFKGRVTDKRPPLPPAAGNPNAMTSGEHKFSWCMDSWCKDDFYSLSGIFCEAVVIADVFSAVGATSFWCPILWYFSIWFLFWPMEFGVSYLMASNGLEGMAVDAVPVLTLWVATIPLALMCATWRKTLREKTGDPNWNGKFITDCLLYWLCGCCAAVQDMRQLDAFIGVRVQCCCRLVQQPILQEGDTIGAPVAVGTTVET